LLLLVLVVAVSLGWTLYKVRQHGIAVAALEKMGCGIEYLEADSESPTVLERLRTLLGEDDGSVFEVNGESIMTGAGLIHLQGLTELKVLYLNDTQVT